MGDAPKEWTMDMSTLTYHQQLGALVYVSRYNANMVADFKQSIPSHHRKWDPNRKAWLVAPEHAQLLVDLTKQYLGESLVIPHMNALSKKTTKVIECRYIGLCRDRGSDERTALVWCDGDWNAVIPESTLRTWFDAPKTPDQELTLYQVLAVKKDSDAKAIKTAYRRLSKQWHPDVCHEPGASEIFRKINDAYSLLSDERKRARYDAGLALAATLGGSEYQNVTPVKDGYRSPLRCGLIMCEGQDKVGRFVVDTILAWEDITNDRNQVLSVSWPIGAERFQEVWA